MNSFIKIIFLVPSIYFLSSCNSDDKTQVYEKVYKSDDSIQCGSIGIDLDVMELELINIGIDVVCSQKGHDGAVRPALCSTPTGNINIYKIYSENVYDAESIGYFPVNMFTDLQDQPCE